MTHRQIELVTDTWLSVAALDPLLVGDLFYLRLFTICPEVKPMFRESLPEQSKKLLHMLNYVVGRLHRLEEIREQIRGLAHRHLRYGVKLSHYTAVGSALLWTLEQGLGDKWSPEVEEAWAACYALLSQAMINACDYVQPIS